jgi:D-alanyl-D-alanine endopeptidase (penicillin-binding protein 7)
MQAKTWGTSLSMRVGVWAAGVAALVCYLTAPAMAAAGEPLPAVRAKTTIGSSIGPATPSRRKARIAADRPSSGQKQGLRGTEDALDLKSSVALVIDQDTDEVLFSKNADAVLPIASITKLMTAIVVLDAAQPMDESIKVSRFCWIRPEQPVAPAGGDHADAR